MDAGYALDLRIATGRPLMIKQFVVLKREREVTPTRIANDVPSNGPNLPTKSWLQ